MNSRWQSRANHRDHPVGDIGAVMPSVAPALDHPNDQPLYTEAELIDLRRTMLLYARLFPPGYERNQRRQIAQSLGRPFQNKNWLDVHKSER